MSINRLVMIGAGAALALITLYMNQSPVLPGMEEAAAITQIGQLIVAGLAMAAGVVARN